jgi:hypothetical protein
LVVVFLKDNRDNKGQLFSFDGKPPSAESPKGGVIRSFPAQPKLSFVVKVVVNFQQVAVFENLVAVFVK